MSNDALSMPLWSKVLFALLVTGLATLSYLYLDLLGKVENNESITVMDTSEILELIKSGQGDLTAKEIADRVQLVADDMANQGKLVIRGEAIWSAPDNMKLKITE